MKTYYVGAYRPILEKFPTINRNEIISSPMTLLGLKGPVKLICVGRMRRELNEELFKLKHSDSTIEMDRVR